MILKSAILKILATYYSHPANPFSLPTSLCSRGLSPRKQALLDAAEPNRFQFPTCSRTCWRGVDAPQKLPTHLPHLESVCNTPAVNTRLQNTATHPAKFDGNSACGWYTRNSDIVLGYGCPEGNLVRLKRKTR